MKKYLLPEDGQFYKANLHCHTDISDGRLSPAEIKRIYKEHGYAVVAYTDHYVMVPHPELADEDFLPLTGYELAVNEDGTADAHKRVCHFCFIALDPDHIMQEIHPENRYEEKDAALLHYDPAYPTYERTYSAECISDMMRIGRACGYFVTYNQPVWSRETYNDYCAFENMHAMEICNYGCIVEGYDDDNPRVYDDMLGSGKRIYCIATDDNHCGLPVDDPKFDAFGGFTMIKADKLEYKTVTDALVKGNFYASQGPLIHDLWFEDGNIHVTCSDAARITLATGQRRAGSVYAKTGEVLNEASFPVKETDGYVRLTVVDERGFKAYTNAYFTDELFGES